MLIYIVLLVYLLYTYCTGTPRIRYPIAAVHYLAIPMHFYEVLFSGCPTFAIESGNLIYVKCNAYPYTGMTVSKELESLELFF